MYCTGVWSYLVGAVTTPVFIAVPLVTIWAGIFPIVVSWWAAGAAPTHSRAGPPPPQHVAHLYNVSASGSAARVPAAATSRPPKRAQKRIRGGQGARCMQACGARRRLAAARANALFAGPCQGRLWPVATQPSSDAPAARARSGPDDLLLRAIRGAELRAPLQAHHAAVVCQCRQQHPVVDVRQGVLARRGQHDGRPRHHVQDDHEGARPVRPACRRSGGRAAACLRRLASDGACSSELRCGVHASCGAAPARSQPRLLGSARAHQDFWPQPH